MLTRAAMVVATASAWLLITAPLGSAEPGVWPDCDPTISESMAECSMPPSSTCAPPALAAYSGLNGGAFICAASGQWAWRAMSYPDWQGCQEKLRREMPC